MKTRVLILVIGLLSLTVDTMSKVEVRDTCYKNSNEEIMYMDLFPWNQPIDEMDQYFNVLYSSNKRMDSRAFYDGENFLLPVGDKNSVIPESFITNLIKQIETSLSLGYVEHISFSDMGHSHFFLPQEFFKEEILPINSSDNHLIYEKLMNNPEIVSLYHTAEQMKFFNNREDKILLTDRRVQKRFYTRNLIGKNDGQANMGLIFDIDASANGANDYKDYRYWGSGFSFSSTAKGCFSYKKNGKKYYFDISIDDVGYQSSGTDDYYGI